MTAAGSRVVGYFECAAPDGSIELLKVALEPSLWRTLFEVVSVDPDPSSITRMIIDALQNVPASDFDDALANYIDNHFRPMPPDLGAFS
ncbi:MAG: hypothetical protein V4795_18860 [Pseudomonadota bacterium]